jgi:MFS family permease
MLQAPFRVVANLRPNIPAGLLIGLAVSTVVFSATPFLVPAVAEQRSIGVGLAGIISTAQLGGFVVATWGAGRLLRPSRRILVIAALLGCGAYLTAATAVSFTVLVVAHVAVGLSLGLISWISWAEVFGDRERVSDVAVIGPLIGTVSSPVLALLVDRSGPDWLYLALAGLSLTPLVFVGRLRLHAAARPRRERHRPTRAAAVILVCLGATTFGGSAVFVFAGAIGQDIEGLSPLWVSLAFSANAVASIPTARFRGVRRLPGLWMAITAGSAVVVAAVSSPITFWVAMAVWGAAFWMGIPGAFALLAERSRYPEERAGDAQAVMALGRVFGPAFGALVVSATSVTVLGYLAGAVMLAAAATMLYVEARIRQFPVYTSLQSKISELGTTRR